MANSSIIPVRSIAALPSLSTHLTNAKICFRDLEGVRESAYGGKTSTIDGRTRTPRRVEAKTDLWDPTDAGAV